MNLLLHLGLAITMVALFACSDSDTTRADKSSLPTTTQQTPTTQAQETAPAPGGGDAPVPSSDGVQAEPTLIDPEALKRRGRAVYIANCVACHNPDPAMDGGIGPAVAGASLALLEARIMRNEYPEGYTPKRDTEAMIALPYLEKDLAAIVAFLAK